MHRVQLLRWCSDEYENDTESYAVVTYCTSVLILGEGSLIYVFFLTLVEGYEQRMWLLVKSWDEFWFVDMGFTNTLWLIDGLLGRWISAQLNSTGSDFLRHVHTARPIYRRANQMQSNAMRHNSAVSNATRCNKVQCDKAQCDGTQCVIPVRAKHMHIPGRVIYNVKFGCLPQDQCKMKTFQSL